MGPFFSHLLKGILSVVKGYLQLALTFIITAHISYLYISIPKYSCSFLFKSTAEQNTATCQQTVLWNRLPNRLKKFEGFLPFSKRTKVAPFVLECAHLPSCAGGFHRLQPCA